MTGGLIVVIQRQYDESGRTGDDRGGQALARQDYRPRHGRAGNRQSAVEIQASVRDGELRLRLAPRWLMPARRAGREYVRDALHTLKCERIDHGVRCEDDPNLMSELAERGIPLTVCPMSNCMLKVFPDMASHNIRRLHDAGLCITVNSDDPPYFGGYINENYAAIQASLGVSDPSCGRWPATGLRARSSTRICGTGISRRSTNSNPLRTEAVAFGTLGTCTCSRLHPTFAPKASTASARWQRRCITDGASAPR